MSSKVDAFDRWIRTSFVELNTELENLYFQQEDRAQVIGRGDPAKAGPQGRRSRACRCVAG